MESAVITNHFPVPWPKGRGPMGALALGMEDCLLRDEKFVVELEVAYSAESRLDAVAIDVVGKADGGFLGGRVVSAVGWYGVSGG